MKGKKVAEVAKRQKGVAKTKRSLAYCISLGQFCMTAETLRALGYRKFSTPFDWCFTNAEMVISRLADNFDQFLDPKLLRKASNGKQNANKKRCGHLVFSKMLGRKAVFNHHNPLIDSCDMDYFARCVKRFRIVLSDSHRKLFVMTARGLYTDREEADRLFKAFVDATDNFLILFIYVAEKCGASRGATTKIATYTVNRPAHGACERRRKHPCWQIRGRRRRDTARMMVAVIGSSLFARALSILNAERVNELVCVVSAPPLAICSQRLLYYLSL
eukprot:GEMP01090564.1.p1 GENE.GEMP01090564.1~~GEMP01090564.1.p1  ORF type:complete len:285 (+),score=46.16 GEMP01090564.1:36-857(+)